MWRLSMETTSLDMVGQHSVGKGRVTGASWSKADPGIVVTAWLATQTLWWPLGARWVWYGW